MDGDGESTADSQQSKELTGDNSTILISLESTIKSHITSLDKLGEELRKHKEMLDDIFANDETYQKHLETAKEATKIKTATKQQILNRPQAKELNEKVKSFKSEIKEQEGALSDYLQEYQRLSGVNEIEGEDGEMREIVYVAKLIRKASGFR